MSSRVLVHHVEVVPIVVRNVVVPARQAKHSADLGRLGEDARLLTEGQDRVDLVVAAGGVEGSYQFLAKHGGLE